jgi:hypothetical protein
VQTLSAPHAPDALAHKRPSHTPSPPSASRARFRGASTYVACDPSRPSRSADPRRLPPADPIGLAPRLRLQLSSRAATGTLTWPPWAQLPTCFHAQLRCALDPGPLPAFAGAPEPHAAYRLLQRSVPRTHLRSAQTLSLIAAANRCASRWRRPLRGPSNRVASG